MCLFTFDVRVRVCVLPFSRSSRFLRVHAIQQTSTHTRASHVLYLLIDFCKFIFE